MIAFELDIVMIAHVHDLDGNIEVGVLGLVKMRVGIRDIGTPMSIVPTVDIERRDEKGA